MTKWTDELQKAYQAGADSIKVANSRTNTGGVTGGEFVIPKEGPGGYEDNPYDDFGDYRGPSVPGHPGWAGELQINPDTANLLLPGESGTTGGLGTMNREALDRYIKENGISGPAAGKLIKKWEGLHGGVNLPLAQGLPQEQLMANRPAGMPQYIYESIQRQYGNKQYGNYTIEDKKNVINWYKKADAGSGGQNIADASDLTNTLSPHQNPRSGSLRGMSEKDRKELLIRGIAALNKA